MKKILICLIGVLALTGCSPRPQSAETNTSSTKVEKTAKDISSKDIAGIIQANAYTTTGYGTTVSVSYVLLKNGEIVIFGPQNVMVLPYTKEEAKIIIKAGLDGKIVNTVKNKTFLF